MWGARGRGRPAAKSPKGSERDLGLVGYLPFPASKKSRVFGSVGWLAGVHPQKSHRAGRWRWDTQAQAEELPPRIVLNSSETSFAEKSLGSSNLG